MMNFIRNILGGYMPRPAMMVPDDPFTCPRTDTIQHLARILEEFRVVHVRGTPASGKTTMAQLLHSYYTKQGIRSIYYADWAYVRNRPVMDTLLQKARDIGCSVDDMSLYNTDIVFIIDEAQMIYHDTGFWLGLVKTQSGRDFGPKICIFSSYGSPTGGPLNFDPGTPLAYLGFQQRVSITPSEIPDSPPISLFYNRSEFDDVVDRVCSDPSQPFRLGPSARDYIFSVTNGQPGGVYSVLKLIAHFYRSQLKQREIEAVEQEHITSLLENEDQVFRFLMHMPVQRSFVNRRELKPEAADVLREVLVNGSIPQDLENDGIHLCYKKGWLHAESLDWEDMDIRCVFPTNLHAKYVEHFLTTSSYPFPIEKYPDIKTLAATVVKEFSPRALLSTTRIGPGAVTRPLEAAYQDEFYRGIHAVLGTATNISSEWSRDKSGRIDFRLVSNGWGFEILREGNRLREHCERFAPGGRYYKWIQDGHITDWLILDCRTTQPHPASAGHSNLWRVVFTPDFLSAEILDSTNSVVFKRFPLAPQLPH